MYGGILSPCVATAGGERRRRGISTGREAQQLTGQVASQDSQYQCGHPLLHLRIIAPMPITSPTMKNQNTCREARLGAKRAQIQAQRIEMTTNRAVLMMRGASEGTRPLTTSPRKRRDSNGSVATTRATESR